MSELLSFEWRRAKSIRTTWITSLFLLASVIGFAYIATIAVQEDPQSTTDSLNFAASNPIAIVLVASLAAMAFGHEYRYGTIRLTLTAFPRRTGVFFSKLLYSLLIPLVVVAAGVGLGYAVMIASGASQNVDWLDLAARAGLYTITIAVLAFALTVITRNHPLGIIGPLLLTILESVLIGVLSERAPWLPKVLPFQSLGNWFSLGATSDGWLGLGVWAAWMIGLLVLGFALLKRRDA